MKETEIKYLSGFFDADGWACFVYNSGYLHLEVGIEQAESTDRDGAYINSLKNKLGGSVSHRQREATWSPTNTWRLCVRSDLEKLLPRLIKHCVIKGKHLQRLLAVYRDMKGVKIDRELFEVYQEYCQESRSDSGPVKPKNHPTWAWLAGYLDGDGYYMMRKRPRQTECRVGVVAHEDDVETLMWLKESFGGVVKDRKDCRAYEWVRNIGPRDKSFAVNFLTKIVRFHPMKKWKIEQILNFHSTRND